MKRVLLILVILLNILQFDPMFQFEAHAVGINIGDYIVVGKYYDQPILWRCVDVDSNGPLMLADKILCLKPFDVKGTHPNDYNSARLNRGSDLWETSNIRAWLNSTDSAGNVNWVCGNPPTSDKIYKGYNSYNNEKGFLADGNFSSNDRMVIKSVTQKSLLNYQDKALATGGTTTLIEDTNIDTVVQNYDSAYYDNVTDNVFLLDVKQMNKLYQNKAILGADYFVGKVTPNAVANSTYKYSSLAAGQKWDSWLRTPASSKTMCDSVRYVDSYNSIIDSFPAYRGDIAAGVRPAFYLNLSSTILESGTGTGDNPYIIKGGVPPIPPPTPTTSMKTIKYTYDKLNRLSSSSNSDGWNSNYAYDAAGNILNLVSSNGDIDLIAPSEPIVTGVEEGKTYITPVTPIWVDVTGTTSTATLDDSSYTTGSAITVDGVHKLVITTTKTSNSLQNIKIIHFTIDTVAPSAPTVTGVEEGKTYGTSVTPAWIDTEGTTSTATLDGSAYTTGTAITVDGTHTLDITTTKTSNSLQNIKIIHFTIDTVAPLAPTVTGVEEGKTYGTSVTPAWIDTEGTTSTTTLDGSAYTTGSAITVDGEHTLVITTTKTSNGLQSTQTIHFTIDTVAPLVPTVTGVEEGKTYGTSVTPAWIDTEGITSTATLDGSDYTTGSAITVDGAHTLVITTTKTSNNLQSTQTIHFTIDIVAPSSPTVTGVEEGKTYGTSVTPAWIDTEGTTSTATLDGSDYTTGSAITVDGVHTLVITTTKTSNSLQNTETIHFTIDTVAPSSPTVTGVEEGKTYGTLVTPAWVDTEGTTSTATLDGSDYTTGSAIITDGEHILVIITTKTSNNLQSTQTIHFTIDTVAPSAPTVTGVENGKTYGASVTPIWGDVTGTTSTATLDGNSYITGSAISVDGYHTLVITTTKTTNNLQNITIIHFTINAALRYGTISGRVTTPEKTDGTYVNCAGVTISIQGTSITTSSAIDGSYTLYNIPAGNYTLIFSKDKYSLIQITNVKVSENTNIKVDELMVLIGDVNLDGSVNQSDYELVKQYVLGKITSFPSLQGISTADIDDDGKITSKDYALLLRMIQKVK